jgi:dolichol-phosphate mannosyltransferase
MTKLISVIIPSYNEEMNIPLVYEALKKHTMQFAAKYVFEIIFINDGSKDNTGQEIEKLASQHKDVVSIELSRNFGKEIATTAGYNLCKGDAGIVIDADMQFPLEKLSEFFEKWEAGADVVVGVRKKNRGEGFIRKIGSALFNGLVNKIADTKIVPNSTDFSLIDRVVIDEFNKFSEHNGTTRALINWLGFTREYVYFDASERLHGTPSYNLSKKVKLALESVVSMSFVPLKLAAYLGVVISLLSGLLGLSVLIGKFFLQIPFFVSFTGTAELAILILFLIGVVLVCLGIISFYLTMIFTEGLNRPLYVIRKPRKVNAQSNK